jgi:hypothetical protein
MTVKASDIDKCKFLYSNSTVLSDPSLRYDLQPRNGREKIPFGVKTESGIIFVKEGLDFELKEAYELQLLVTDGKFNASTLVVLRKLTKVKVKK